MGTIQHATTENICKKTPTYSTHTPGICLRQFPYPSNVVELVQQNLCLAIYWAKTQLRVSGYPVLCHTALLPRQCVSPPPIECRGGKISCSQIKELGDHCKPHLWTDKGEQVLPLDIHSAKFPTTAFFHYL